MFATVLAISSVSLLVGCTDAVPEDPTAEERGKANKDEGGDGTTTDDGTGGDGTGTPDPDDPGTDKE